MLYGDLIQYNNIPKAIFYELWRGYIFDSPLQMSFLFLRLSAKKEGVSVELNASASRSKA